MVSQAIGGCSFIINGERCGSKSHTKMYHKPRKPIAKTPLKRSVWDDKTKLVKVPLVKKKKAETRGKLVKKLDQVFSRYIRLLEPEFCVTCNDAKPRKELQNGHFYTRGRYSTRWDEMNCHPQCYKCNVILNGNYIKYTMYMINRYGTDAVNDLEIKSTTQQKIPTPTLKDLIEEYKEKVKELEKLHGTE